ncbi:hypothetical protein ABPG72_012421 [Tetrahymena utriculariae]
MTDQNELNLAIMISASVVCPFYYIQMITLLIQLYKIIKMNTVKKQFFILFYFILITITLCSLFQVTIQIFKEAEDVVNKKLIEQIAVNFCDTFKVLLFSISILMLCYKWYELYLNYFYSVRTAKSQIRRYKICATVYVVISLIVYVLSIIFTGVKNDYEGFNYNEDLILPSSLVCFNLLICIVLSVIYSQKLNKTINNLEKELGTILKKKRYLICFYMIFILNFLKITLLLTQILYYYFSGEPFKMKFLASIGYVIAYLVSTEIILNFLPVCLMAFFIIPYSSKSEKKYSQMMQSSSVEKINQSLMDENKSTILVESQVQE